MPVIHPSLFLIMERFPEHKDALREKYRIDENFRDACQNYKKCSEALKYWTNSKDENAPDREKEYSALLQELEQEILKSLEDSA